MNQSAGFVADIRWLLVTARNLLAVTAPSICFTLAMILGVYKVWDQATFWMLAAIYLRLDRQAMGYRSVNAS